MTLTKFNDETMMRFVRAYKGARCLWDTKHPDYKVRKMRSAMYHYIVKVMNIPGFTVGDVKNKIQIIRGVYRQELKKIALHGMMGMEPYVPTVVWFAEFHEFMSAILMQRETNSNNHTMMNSEYRLCECVLPESQGNSDVPCVVSSVTSINGDMTDLNSDISQTIDGVQNSDISQTTDGVQDSYSVSTNYRICPSVEAILGRLERLSQSLVKKQKQSKEDEFDCFGKSVTQQLRKLPLVSAMRLKIKIQTLLSEERINCLGENSKKKTSEQTVDDVIVMEEGEENKENTEKVTDRNTEKVTDRNTEKVTECIEIMEEGEENKENIEKVTDRNTEKVTECVEIIMEEGEENNVNSEKLVENIETIIIDEETEKAEQTEKVVENTITVVDEREERPSSRVSELSLHVSCSSSDDEESEIEY